MSIWQTKSWWEMLVKSNQAEKIIETNWVFIEKRAIALWEYGLFVLWLEKELNKQDINNLLEVCKKEDALFLQIETLDYLKEKNIEIDWFKNCFYKKFITPYTAVIDLSLSEDDILLKMKPKWRYNIRLAFKKWIEVKKVEKTSENIEEFYELIIETTMRDGFFWNTLDYYNKFLELEESELLIAYKDNIAIAWAIFVFNKDESIYYYWASTSNPKYRNLMAPYLLQWEAIKIAKEFWSKYYDFLWVAKPWDRYSSLSWVTDFKLKLTPDVREVSESLIYINKKWKFKLIQFIRKLRKKY